MTESSPLRRVLIAPSLLSADFARLGEEAGRVLEAGAGILHFDVMDGHFVPNLTIGPAVVAALAPAVRAKGALVDVHLMIERPDSLIPAFAEAGASAISVHVEAVPHLHRTLTLIRDLGAYAGIAINPATPPAAVEEAVNYADYVLAMTVNPGFGGQAFIPESLDKVRRLRRLLPADVALEVDGGVAVDTLPGLREAGANWFVAGSAIFGAPDPAVEVRRLRDLLA